MSASPRKRRLATKMRSVASGPIAEIQKWQRSPLVQCRCDLFHQFGLGIGLLKDSRFAEILEKLVIAVTGDDYHGQGGMCGVDGCREFTAVHFRHGKISQHEIDLQSACDQRKRFSSTYGWNRGVSKSVEQFEGGPEDCLIVIDDQNTRTATVCGTLHGIDRFPFA